MRSRHVSVLMAALALAWAIGASAFTVQPLFGQDTTAAAAGAQRTEIDALLSQVRERFQVRPLRNGVLLSPKYAPANVGDIEVSGGTIAIGGNAVTGSEVEKLLGKPDAELVIRLSYVPPSELVRNLGAASQGPEIAGPGPAPAGTIARADTAGAAGAQVAEPSQEQEEPEEAEETEESKEPQPPEPPGEPVGDQVRMGGNITVPKGETVLGDVVAIGGDVDVEGRVLGDVVSLGGVLRLYDTARVNGDAVAVGGRLEKDPGAQVLGKTTTVGVQLPFVMGHRRTWEASGPVGALVGFLVTLLWIALLLILGAVFLLVMSRHVDRAEANLRSSPLKAGLVGFLAQLFFLPVYVIGLVLLVITIIGIPIAVLWAVGFFVLGFVAAFFGFTAVARAVGRSVMERLGRPLSSSYVALLMGLIVLSAPMLFHNLFHLGPGMMDFFAMLFFGLGCLVLYIAFTIGFGAAILTRFGTRTTWSGEPPPGFGEPAAPPPPAPPPPPPPAPPGEPFPEPAYRALPESPAGRLVQGEGSERPTMLASSAGGDEDPEATSGNENLPPG
jgi:hypothetical protein